MRRGFLNTTSKGKQKASTKATKEVEQQQSSNKFSISQFPNHILVNILSRLPFKTIHTCKCVCKSWLKLFSEPYFADTHFKNSQTCILVHPFLMNFNPKRKNPFVLDWKIPNGFDNVMVKFDPNAILLSNHCILADSCDGLVCLSCLQLGGAFCICNPISGEYVMVPPVRNEMRCNSMKCFGLSPKDNKYKMVVFSGRFDNRNLPVWAIDIFTIGMDNTWRSIGKPVSLGGDPADVFLNGRIHWVVSDCNDSEFIRCFDFDFEGFQYVSPPKEFGADDKKRSKLMNLGIMDDCICLCDYSVDGYIDIWVMKEYGVQESWTKRLVISASITSTKNSLPMILLGNSECVIFSSNKMLVIYNLKDKKLTKFEMGMPGKNINGAMDYKPSFILLEEISRRQNWKLVDIRKHRW